MPKGILSVKDTPVEEEQKPEKKGKIFNTLPSKNDVEKQEEVVLPQKEVAEEDDDDDDWGAIPAFLRRSKLK
jgi:hypothetical protein